MADSGGCKCIRDCIGDQVPWCAECCAGSSLDCPRQYSGLIKYSAGVAVPDSVATDQDGSPT